MGPAKLHVTHTLLQRRVTHLGDPSLGPWTMNVDSVSASSGSPSVDSLKTRAGKRKVASTQALPPKVRKVVGKKLTGLKINDPSPRTPSTPAPPSSTRGGFKMRRSTR
jgi:hypothetical protein